MYSISLSRAEARTKLSPCVERNRQDGKGSLIYEQTVIGKH